MSKNLRLQVSFTFPYRWLDNPEDRKYLADNLQKAIRKGGLHEVYQTSASDRYFADVGGNFIDNYFVRLKYHAYQPVKIDLTKTQLAKYLKPVFPNSRLIGFEPFFVQSNHGGLPIMEMEVYY